VDNWHPFITAVLAFVLSMIGITYQLNRQRDEKDKEEQKKKTDALAEKVTKLESTSVTEHQVAKILRDIQSDINEIKVQIAELPKECPNVS
jgi:Tfp pilus assembly protein PilN